MERGSYGTCVDAALKILDRWVDDESTRHMENLIQTVQLDLKFFKMLFWGLDNWEESEDDLHLLSVVSDAGRKLREIAEEIEAQVQDAGDMMNWEERFHYLHERTKLVKQDAKEICIFLLGGTFKFKSCQHDEKLFLEYQRETATFIDFILKNLEALNSQIDLIAPVKQQIAFIQGKLKVFGKFADLVAPVKQQFSSIQGKLEVFGKFAYRVAAEARSLGELVSHTRIWTNHISCLACLYWIEEMDESMASSMGIMLSQLMQKTMPYTPEVIALYLDVLKDRKCHKFDGPVIPRLLTSYIDFLLEDVAIPMKDDIEILREGLIFLFSFTMDQFKENLVYAGVPSEDGKLILQQIDAIICEVPYVICSIHVDEMKEGISETNFSSFLKNIERVKAELSDKYVMTTHSTWLNYPMTNPVGFLDSLLGGLKKMLGAKVNFIASVQYGVQIILEELASLSPFLQNIMELGNEFQKLMHLCARIVNVVYYAAYVTNLCSAPSCSVWYGILCLPNVIEEIKLIKSEVEEIQDNQTYKNKMLNANMESSNAMLAQSMTSQNEGTFIGFEKDARFIRDQLVGGRKDLTIISIWGMAGQGKTTLAKKLYDDLSIQYHFHKTVWCYVSKSCRTRELLINIARAVGLDDVELEIQDLIERLRKSFKRKRFLIVMDDIWDVNVWHEVQLSFPDDTNGSRIIFTSRNHDLASQANLNSISHGLPLFSGEESWELLKEKVFSSVGCPSEFLETGKQIAIYCKGLPLAVVVVASLLKKSGQKLDLWKEVAENLKSHLASEGCMHILELSYKNLSDHLRPCFLYFGAFSRGQNIRARKLKLLWIAEGFINKNGMQCSEDLANKYLDNLVSQSLVVVTERSSTGGIKTCNVHDMLYDLCLEKAVKENFLHRAEKNIVVDQLVCRYKHHRFCIGTHDPFIKASPICIRKELPTSQVHSLLWFLHGSILANTSDRGIPFLESFKVLTVLDLDGVLLRCDGFPKEILSIVNLRYLALLGRTNHIPPSIADLWNLETLIMRGAQLKDPLPNTMWKMKSLIHVNITDCHLQFQRCGKNDTCSNIQSLGGPIILCYDDPTVEFLRSLPNLRKLHCSFEGKFNPMWFSMFESLNKLERLRMAYYTGSSSLPELEKSPIINLPENLKKLTLEGFGLPWNSISTIGKQLPNLEVLKLVYEACAGDTWDLEDVEFSKLRYLKLSYLSVEEIDVSCCDSPFPCLEELVVESCGRLKEIPSSFGEICTLNAIKLIWGSRQASESLTAILEQQRDMENLNFQVFVQN